MTELPTDAIRYCIEGCRDYKYNTGNEPDTAYAELQALLDALAESKALVAKYEPAYAEREILWEADYRSKLLGNKQ